MGDLYTIASHKTPYGGCWYDSYTEARWAALLDMFGFVVKKPRLTGKWDPDFGFRTDCRSTVFAECKPYGARSGWPEPNCRWLDRIWEKLAHAVDEGHCDEAIAIGDLSFIHKDLSDLSLVSSDEVAIVGLRLKSARSHSNDTTKDRWEPVHIHKDRFGRYVYQGHEEYRKLKLQGREVQNPLSHLDLLKMWGETETMVGHKPEEAVARKPYDFDVFKKQPQKRI
jgi:hypothetical protein